MTRQSQLDRTLPVVGRNGVAIEPRAKHTGSGSPGYRTYEVHQRERVGESTEKIKAAQLVSDDYRRDPYPMLEILRENYPCYRDWPANRYWITRYDDVTSIFTDDANYESRHRTWFYGMPDFGRDLGTHLDLLSVEAERIDNHAEPIARRLAGELANAPTGDLARDFAGRFPLELLAAVLDIPSPDQARFFDRYWRAQRGVSWQPVLHDDGKRALQELVDYFAPLLEARRRNPGEDLISAMADLAVDGKPVGASDVVVTLLERDHETLHGALANLWYLLLTHPDEYAKARSERRLMKLAYLETLRHSPPVLSAERFARHEVERFGRLLPEGALLVCSAAAANRDPRVFSEPDRFIVDRKDLCQREARGQYRADGLASGIAFRLGKPSVHPAVPEDRPRSRYAITRDTAVTASMVLLDAFDDISLAPGARPGLSALTVGEMHTCWQLPVTLRPH